MGNAKKTEREHDKSRRLPTREKVRDMLTVPFESFPLTHFEATITQYVDLSICALTGYIRRCRLATCHLRLEQPIDDRSDNVVRRLHLVESIQRTECVAAIKDDVLSHTYARLVEKCS